MRVYGYDLTKKKKATIELSEISLSLSPSELRDLSRFFATTADTMEKWGDKFGHEHFSDFLKSKLQPDIIVIGIAAD